MNGQRTKVKKVSNLYRYVSNKGIITYRFVKEIRGQRIDETLSEGTTEAQAVQWAHNKISEMMSKSGRISTEPSRKKLADFIDNEYIPNYMQMHAERSLRRERGRLIKIKNSLGHLFVDEITIRNIRTFMASLKEKQDPFEIPEEGKKVNGYQGSGDEGLSNATINRYRARLNSIFNEAISYGYRNDNPIKGHIKNLPEPKPINRWLERDEFQALLDRCDDKLKRVIIFVAATGIRRSKLFDLQWHQVHRNLEYVALEDTKNGEMRNVPLNPDAKAVLTEIGRKDIGRVFGFNDLPDSFNTARAIFGHRKDKTLDSRTRGWTLHDFRHHCASWMVMNGVTLLEVKEILGHKSIVTTQRYAHLSNQSLINAVGAIPLMLSNQPDLKVVRGSG